MSSNNASFDLLFSQFHKVSRKSLWILDENPPLNLPPVNDLIEIVSNRFDVVEKMRLAGYQASYQDFTFDNINNCYQFIFYRISKEKAVSHFVINSAQRLLEDNGTLVISGAKQEGIKGYIERASLRYSKIESFKADKQHWAGVFKNKLGDQALLDDKDYQSMRIIHEDNNGCIYSKPGVFGWDKLDSGSQLLVEQLPSLFKDRSAPEQILDIGCGYGFISLHCSSMFNAAITACDNNAAAITACRYNFEHNQVNGQVIATDCTLGISAYFDLIVCNPPFHSGFAVENDLTQRFLESAAARLSPDGLAVFVVNLHIPLERKASNYFKSVTSLHKNDHFKIVLLHH